MSEPGSPLNTYTNTNANTNTNLQINIETFPTNAAENSVPRSFTLEQTIDLLERRQEAAVLRHLRELKVASPIWANEWGWPLACTQTPSASHPYTTGGFHALSKAEIAEVMAGEQQMLESRIRRVARRSVSLGKGN